MLCYICSVFWYQDVADLAYRHHRRIKNEVSLTKSLSNTVYSTLVWFMAYSQTVILSKIVPIVLGYYLDYIIEPLFHRTVAFSFFARSFVELLSASSQILGLLMTACMYGWYAFDSTWYACNTIPLARSLCLKRCVFLFSLQDLKWSGHGRSPGAGREALGLLPGLWVALSVAVQSYFLLHRLWHISVRIPAWNHPRVDARLQRVVCPQIQPGGDDSSRERRGC